MNKRFKDFLSQIDEKYQRVILDDVQGPHYARSTVWFVRLYAFFLTILTLTYVFFFHRFLVRNFSVFVDLHESAFNGSAPTVIRILVYKYEYFIYFLIFMSLFMIFLVIGFFAYDFHQRNALIAKLIKKTSHFPKEQI